MGPHAPERARRLVQAAVGTSATGAQAPERRAPALLIDALMCSSIEALISTKVDHHPRFRALGRARNRWRLRSLNILHAPRQELAPAPTEFARASAGARDP